MKIFHLFGVHDFTFYMDIHCLEMEGRRESEIE